MCIINSDIILYLPSCMAGTVFKIVPYRSIEPFLTKYGINRPFKTNFKGSSAERPNMGKKSEWCHLKFLLIYCWVPHTKSEDCIIRSHRVSMIIGLLLVIEQLIY